MVFCPLIIAIAGIVIAATVAWVPEYTGAIIALMLIYGTAQSTIPVSTFALPADVTKPERVGLAFGILYTGLNVGVLIGPALAGLLRDVSGSYQGSYFLMAGFAILATIMMIILGIRKKRVTPTIS